MLLNTRYTNYLYTDLNIVFIIVNLNVYYNYMINWSHRVYVLHFVV